MKNLYILFVLAILCSCSTQNNKVYQFRGEGRNGIYQESNLLKEWPEEGPEEIWSIQSVGNGFSTPIFTEDKFYIAGETDSLAILYCFDLEGNMIWQTKLGGEWMRSFPGARMAATIAGDLVYTGTGLGDLYCLDADNGDLIWSKGFDDDFGGIQMLHGYSEAPVIDGDKVFWTPGGKEFNAVGLDRYTGEIIWSNKGFGERSGYNQGQLIELAERKIYVTFSAYHLMGFDTETGELLWSQEQDNLPMERRTLGYGDTHTNPVIFDDGFIYYATADGLGGIKLELSADGSEITEVWRNKSNDALMGGLMKIDDYLYCASFSHPFLRSFSASTGEITDSLRIGRGSLIAADGLFYYYSQFGNMLLLSYDNGDIEEISSFKITKGDLQHFSHPVINKSVLYIRHGQALIAYDIKEKTL